MSNIKYYIKLTCSENQPKERQLILTAEQAQMLIVQLIYSHEFDEHDKYALSVVGLTDDEFNAWPEFQGF